MMTVLKRGLCLAFALWLGCTFGDNFIAPAAAQTPPTPAEIAAYTGLHAAAARGDTNQLRDLIQKKTNLETRDSHGRTAVHIAAHGGHQTIVRELARAGADLKALDSRRYDIITIAAVKDDVEMVKLAISLGANPRSITSPYDGTALIAAAHLGHADVVRALIAAKAPLDHVNNLGWTAVIEAVILGDGGARHQATLKALVDAGANIALADRDGRTPLAHATARGYREMVHILSRK
jgi:uncharacterized protein